jgi:hypothetical protein
VAVAASSPQAAALPLQDLFPDVSPELLASCAPESISTCVVTTPLESSGLWNVQLVSEKTVGQAVFGVIGAAAGAFGGCSADPMGTRVRCEDAPGIGDTVAGADSFTVGPEDFGVARSDTLYISLLSPAETPFNDPNDPLNLVPLGALTFPGPLLADNFTLEGVADLFGPPAFAQFESGASLDAEVGFVVVPEPSSFALLLGPVVSALALHRRRRSGRRRDRAYGAHAGP